MVEKTQHINFSQDPRWISAKKTRHGLGWRLEKIQTEATGPLLAPPPRSSSSKPPAHLAGRAARRRAEARRGRHLQHAPGASTRGGAEEARPATREMDTARDVAVGQKPKSPVRFEGEHQPIQPLT